MKTQTTLVRVVTAVTISKHRAEQLMAAIRERSERVARTGDTIRVENAINAGPAKMYIYDMIGGWEGIRARDVVNSLSKITSDIDVHINSGGGDIFEGVAIHNALKNHKGTVTTYVDGVAASAASFIAMAADKIVIEPNGTMMIHDGSALCMGNASDMRDAADLLDMLSDMIAEMYSKRAGGSKESWREKMRAETWYNASEALAAGLVSEISGAAAAATSGQARNELKLDLAIFNLPGPELAVANTVQETSTPVDTTPPATAIDVEGLRSALKGAFV